MALTKIGNTIVLLLFLVLVFIPGWEGGAAGNSFRFVRACACCDRKVEMRLESHVPRFPFPLFPSRFSLFLGAFFPFPILQPPIQL